MVTKAVFGLKEAPKEFYEEYLIAKRIHRRYVKLGWITFIIGLLTGGTLLLFLNLQLIMFIPIFIISAITGGGIVLSDKRFYKVKEIAEWYGISG